MNQMMGSFESIFSTTCNQYLAKRLIRQVNTTDPSGRLWAKKELEDTLRENGVAVLPSYDAKGHVKNSSEIIKAFPTQEDLEQRLYARLSELYVQFPGTKVFIERLVNNLGDPEFAGGSIRLHILRQFLMYIRKSVYSVKKLRNIILQKASDEEKKEFKALKEEEEKRRFLALHAREEIFDALDHPQEYGLKADDLRLLSLSDNFSRGRILNQGGTRRGIYEFAIVFGMNSYLPSEDAYDPERDIEKNLFFDFQINGYIDILRERSSKAGADTANDELTTEGINYKNYAEVIYLYVINNPNIKREDKIYIAQSLIKACDPGKRDDTEAEETQMYRDYALSDLMTEQGFHLSQDDFLAYVSQHFPAEQNRSVSPLMLSASQNTAKHEYLCLCEQFEDELRLYDRSLDELDYTLGIFFGNASASDEAEYPFPDDLRMVLVDLNDELRRHSIRRNEIIQGYQETVSRKGELRREKTVLRRIDFFILFYEYFIAVHEDDSEEVILRLEDVFYSFVDHLNPVLERSRYALVSAKSMPDVLLILFAYNMVSLLS